MTAPRDPDRLIHTFLMEGEELLEDQVFDAVRAGIERKRQRAFIGSWRTPIMNRFVTFGLAAVGVLAVALIGSRLLERSNAVGPSTSQTPLTTQSPAASVQPTASADAGLPLGTYTLWDGSNGVFDGSSSLGIRIRVTIPAAGWFGGPAEGVIVKNKNVQPPDGAGIAVFARTNDLIVGSGDVYVYGDPCHWATTRPHTPVRTVDEAVAALTNQPSRKVGFRAATDVTYDGHPGKRFTLQVPRGTVISDCDRGEFRTLVEGGNPLLQTDPGQVDLMTILDVNGELVIFDVAYHKGTPASVLDEMAAIVTHSMLDYDP